MELIIPPGQRGKYLYEQIYEYIKAEIKSGKMLRGEKLPSTRKLASSLRLSRSTVQLAYGQLEAEGYIEGSPGRGYYILDIEGLYDQTKQSLGEGKVLEIGKDPREESFAGCRIDFSPVGIDFTAFPYGVWRKLARETFNDENQEMFAAGEGKGEAGLREEIARYLHRARGVEADPDRILIGAGNEYLMMLLGLLFKKQRIAMENPTYGKAYRLFCSMGWEVLSMDMDESGMRADLLRNSNASFAYIMPSHQYPTGIVMPAARRRELINWAMEGEHRYIIEDDYDSEFRYRGRPIPAMQGMGGEECIIYTGTLSKAIAPAIRASFMLLPRSLMRRYEKNLSYLSCTVPKHDQNILLHFLSGGYFERHLNKMRTLYKSKQEALLEELADFSGDFRIHGDQAGLHVIIESPDQEDRTLAKKALAKGVRVYPLSDFFIRKQERKNRSLILGFAALSREEIKEGCGILRAAWGIKGGTSGRIREEGGEIEWRSGRRRRKR